MPDVVSLNGFPEVEAFIGRLKDAPSPESLREPFFRAAEVYQQDVRTTLPPLYKQPNRNGHVPRGNLIRGLRRRMPRRGRGGRVSEAANHAHLIDKGTADRYTRSGKFRGRVQPTLFWTHAKQRSTPRAQRILLAGVTKVLTNV